MKITLRAAGGCLQPWLYAAACAFLAVPALWAQAPPASQQGMAEKSEQKTEPDSRKTAAGPQGMVLDSVLAVVNHQVILASDLELELRMMRLLPARDSAAPEVTEALDQLTTRALIEQQILLEDPHGLEVDPAQLNASLAELRQTLPACRKHDCATSAGWSAYLATLGLTPGQVERYWIRRMAVLAFIERRFRSGIRIAPEEIEKYYRQTLLPQYPSPASAPPLDQVSSRIQDLLLEQQVNALLDDWLKNLQTQGEVEILDPALAASAEKANAAKSSDGQTGGKP